MTGKRNRRNKRLNQNSEAHYRRQFEESPHIKVMPLADRNELEKVRNHPKTKKAFTELLEEVEKAKEKLKGLDSSRAYPVILKLTSGGSALHRKQVKINSLIEDHKEKTGEYLQHITKTLLERILGG